MTDEPISWDYEALNSSSRVVTPDLLLSDPEFLLRCALTYNWDALLSFCSIILDVLWENGDDKINADVKSAADHFSDDVTALQREATLLQQRKINAARSQLMQRDQWGNTPLHAACYNKPPLSIIKVLLECASAVSPPIQLHTFLARDQSSALSIACATGATARVIQALLIYTYNNNSKVSAQRTNNGVLISGGCMVCVADSRGCTPLTELVVQYELQRKTPRWLRTQTPPLDQVRNLETDSYELLQDFWTKVKLLLRSSWEYDEDHNIFPPGLDHHDDASSSTWISYLHAAANISHAVPSVLTQLISRSFPASTNPLHLAISSMYKPNYSPFQIPQSTMATIKCCRDRQAAFIETLVDPESARQPINVHSPDVLSKTTTSALCYGIMHGLQWHTALVDNIPGTCCVIVLISKAAPRPEAGPLQYLYQNYPAALMIRDSITGLHPFALAATVKQEDGKYYDIDEDVMNIAQLDTIYSLLRLHPQLIAESS